MNARSQRRLRCPRSVTTRALRGSALVLGSVDPCSAGWQRDVSTGLTKLGDVRLPTSDRAGALLAYNESLAIRRKLASAIIRRDLLRLGFSVANPLPHRTEAPIIAVVDVDQLGKGERLVFFCIAQAPDMHLAAIAKELSKLLAGDQTFIAKVAKLRSTTTPSGLRVGMLLNHVFALRLAERVVRSGKGELVSELGEVKTGQAKNLPRNFPI